MGSDDCVSAVAPVVESGSGVEEWQAPSLGRAGEEGGDDAGPARGSPSHREHAHGVRHLDCQLGWDDANSSASRPR